MTSRTALLCAPLALAAVAGLAAGALAAQLALAVASLGAACGLVESTDG